MFTSTLIAVLALFFLLWVASLLLRDASIVDRFWGLAFLVIASAARTFSDGFDGRACLALALTAVWGIRLSIHITARNLGHGEDYRYRAMRRYWGAKFPLVSLVTVFGLQALLAWIVSLPTQAAISAQSPDHFTLLDAAGLLTWIVGFAFETLGDWQLRRFKSDPASKGRTMDRGLWRYTRHPNYFGDALLWWGLWLLAGSTGAWWTAVGPALMTFLLVRVSGVSLLEVQLRKNKPDYEAYCSRTSAFLPRPPRTG